MNRLVSDDEGFDNFFDELLEDEDGFEKEVELDGDMEEDELFELDFEDDDNNMFPEYEYDDED